MEGSVYSYASAEPSDASFTGPVALLLSMWYMHSMLRGHVSVCVYVCVCVRVFFSTACVSRFWLSAEPRPPPHDWLIAPCDVTACSVLEWESRCAPLLVSVLSACADVSSFLWVKLASCVCFFGTCPFWFLSVVLTSVWNWISLPLVFSGEKTSGMFSSGKGLVAWLHRAAALQHKDWLFPSPRHLF